MASTVVGVYLVISGVHTADGLTGVVPPTPLPVAPLLPPAVGPLPVAAVAPPPEFQTPDTELISLERLL